MRLHSTSMGARFATGAMALALGMALVGASVAQAASERAVQGSAQHQDSVKHQDPAKQLEQVRTSLVEAALASQSRVQALAFVDSQGRLHEATRFQSDVSMTYKGEPKLEKSGGCKPHLRFKRHAQLQLVPGHTGDFFGQVDLQTLQARLRPDLMSVLAAETGWLISSQPDLQGLSGYERALVQTPAGRAPYLLRVQLDDLGAIVESRRFPSRPEWLNEPLKEWGLVREQPARQGRLGLQLILVDQGGKTLMSQRTEIIFSREPRGLGAQPDLVFANPDQARLAMDALKTRLKAQLSCDPPDYPAGRTSDPARLELSAGRAMGLAVGDRLLIAPAQGWAGLALNPGLVSQLAIAEVSRVTDYSAELSVAAGPSPSPTGPVWATPL